MIQVGCDDSYMNNDPQNNTDNLSHYYRELHALIDTVTAHNGFANLGWLPPDDANSTYANAQQNLVRFVSDKLKTGSGKQILEVGCGMGGPARYAAKRLGTNVTGLELLPEQIEAGKQVADGDEEKATFVQGSAEAMPFPSNSFDGVYSIESAFHYPDKSKFVREAARVAKFGTRIVVADIVLPEEDRGGWIEKQLKRAVAAPNFFSVDDYLQTAQENGLELIESHDLTQGVAKSLGRMAPLIWKHWSTLRQAGYKSIYLMTIYVIARFCKYFVWLVPSRYMLFVFGK